jgi:hypothetical protein
VNLVVSVSLGGSKRYGVCQCVIWSEDSGWALSVG